ncbi:DUF29 domain-containing protein [Candidatus Synechococcus calcipolaris G9]|uniref:DUF29 domain-containing protein n=1 Tax=Candidatus Synechococcus calcipolaris G9 TaxID=1497997 RepID=A0ABT6EWU8_9SYNE|nr:DUF29 domain-containing protein [Candidatus Synechococcus calcipolaris]MDG2990197.1 DUF29 domain-containing protein [Candidatus Synechococcus calcipolaris G9]
MTVLPLSPSLYDRDYALWIEDTLTHLRNRDGTSLDWQNLVEEMDALGKSQKREIESRLRVLLTHLLKRCYVPSPEDYRGWQNTIAEQRSELELLLKQSPSLKAYFLNVLPPAYAYADQRVRADYPHIPFPQVCPFELDMEIIGDRRFW